MLASNFLMHFPVLYENTRKVWSLQAKANFWPDLLTAICFGTIESFAQVMRSVLKMDLNLRPCDGNWPDAGSQYFINPLLSQDTTCKDTLSIV